MAFAAGGYSQGIYVKFDTKSEIKSTWVTLYLTGDKIPYVGQHILPSNSFCFLRCHGTATTYEIFLDFISSQLKQFPKLPDKYHCGDSILVDMDKRTAVILNKK